MRRHVLFASLGLSVLPALAMAQTASTPTAPPAPDAPAMPHAGHCGNPGAKMIRKFDAANTTHDGHLTLAQAKAANLTPVVANFSDIDTKNRGYVTINDIQAWHLDDVAKKMEAKADALRAKD